MTMTTRTAANDDDDRGWDYIKKPCTLEQFRKLKGEVEKRPEARITIRESFIVGGMMKFSGEVRLPEVVFEYVYVAPGDTAKAKADSEADSGKLKVRVVKNSKPFPDSMIIRRFVRWFEDEVLR